MTARRTLALPILALSLLSACGGGPHPKAKAGARSSPPAVCPPNRSFMGCATPTQGLRLQRLAPPAGALFPDVSVWQGAVNWPSVSGWQRAHGWHPAAIFKLGEYTLDAQAGRNAQQTQALGFWRAGYWFVRNTGCAHEGSLIVWAAKRYGVKVVALDEEVPEAAGYDLCLTGAVKAAGLVPVTYSGPGTWPGGRFAANPAWTATYGPQVGCLPWSCKPVAWQFTDGRYGSVVSVPGIGADDVSVDWGIEKLGAPAPQPKVRCFGAHQANTPQCQRLRAQVAGLLRGEQASRRAYDATARNVAKLQALEALFAARETRLGVQAAELVKAWS